jgi:elongation factor P
VACFFHTAALARKRKIINFFSLFTYTMSASLLSFTRQANVRWSQQLPRTLPFANKRFYKLSVGSVKKGQIVQLKDKAWRVLTRDHVSTGRGGAVVKVTQY